MADKWDEAAKKARQQSLNEVHGRAEEEGGGARRGDGAGGAPPPPRRPQPDPSGRPEDLELGDLMRAAKANFDDITEADLADIFAERAEGRLIFVHGLNKWFEWTGVYWREDERQRAFEAVMRLGQGVSDALPAKEVKLRRSTRRAGFARGVETFARVNHRLAVAAGDLDLKLDLLGTPGGTYDLRTGKLVPTAQANFITKQTLVAPVFTRPRKWLRFLIEMTGGDRKLIRWLQRWMGYSCTGHAVEEQLAFVHGPGGGGKGTFLTTTEKLLGDYATTASMKVFLSKRDQGHTTEIAHLRGARYVIAQETAKGTRWDEEMLKRLTGGDRITARFMRQDNITFDPQYTLTLAGNHPPALHDADEAIRRRFNVVPFTRKPRRVDRTLKLHLLEVEGPQILGWMIQGAVGWYAAGLPERPAVMAAATEKYFAEQDLFTAWLAAMCHLGPSEQDKLANLHKSYVAFTGEKDVSAKALAEMLRKHGFREHKNMYDMQFRGIKSEQPAVVP